ncbi:EAL domain-containing protein [Kineococcus sp. SYSU DK006]|uniref:EAL domain-containing protein n=1 Tax=Kineococcus sp. SYSU DK006 TaxID=3383127 RepID=UPI003D7ED6E1
MSAQPADGTRRSPRGRRWRPLPRCARRPPLERADWRRRHRWVCAVLLALVVAVPVLALVRGTSPVHAVGLGAVLAVALLAAQLDTVRRWFADDPSLPAWSPDGLRACAAVLGLLLAAAEVVQLCGGAPQAHVAFVALVPVLVLYESWAPVLLSTAFVLLQQGVVGTLHPHLVFADAAHPWRQALAHAAVVGATAALALAGWRHAPAAGALQGRELARLRHAAAHDPLTGLVAPAGVRAALTAALADGEDRDAAVLVLGLDGFADLEAELGHEGADELLRQVAVLLQEVLRAGDVLGRTRPHEFTVVLPGGSAREGRAVAGRLREALAGRLAVAGAAVEVPTAVGVTSRHHARRLRGGERGFAAPPQEAAALLRQADAALHAACGRDGDGSGVALYAAGDEQRPAQRLELLADLGAALTRRGELFLVHLPTVDVRTGRVVGVEALLRWRHPERGLLPPATFVPAVTATALADPLTDFVLRSALADAARWNAAGGRVQVSVNVPGRCLRAGFAERVLALLAAAGVGAQQLRLEVTEEALTGAAPAVHAELVRLRQAGTGVSVDDVGSAAAPLSAVRTLPVDELKLDGALVAGLVDEDPLARHTSTLLVRSVVEVAHALSLRVVAERVETAALARAVADAGCDLAQGYHFARPATADAVAALLAAEPAGEVPANS